MKTLKIILIGILFILMSTACSTVTANESTSKANKISHSELKREAREFMDTYINTYNKRFGHPERKDSFINELSNLLNEPFIMAPPTAAPRYPETVAAKTRAFDGFINILEKKGAVKLQWQEVNLKVLNQHKILANNVGVAVDANGEVVYETISIYLLYRTDNGWKIVLFSPYDMRNKLSF